MFRTIYAAGTLGLFLGGTACAQPTYYEGAIENNGDQLGIRLTIDPDDAAATTLDIPQLWYAEEPIEASVTSDGHVVATFPFGLGEMNFAPTDEGWATDGTPRIAELREGTAAPYSKTDIRFGQDDRALEGTLYVPDGAGPHPAVIIVGGSGSGSRSEWTYRSKADYYARLGVAALVYDRPAYGEIFADGSTPDFWSHAKDLDVARTALAQRRDIDGAAIGLHGGSQGVWLSTIAQAEHGGFAFMVMTGFPAVSPGDQQLHSLIYGMRDDTVDESIIAGAIAYQRLYFAVAHNQQGWETLQQAMEDGADADWFQYVDQPESVDDLQWWAHHQAYEPRDHLSQITIPILAMTGEGDWITPPVENLPKLESYASRAGNEHVVTMVLPGADHRLERSPWEDEDGQWHWFEIASEARAAIPAFLEDHVGLDLNN